MKKFKVYYYGKVWEKAMAMKTWPDFFAAFWKGPGWFPGTERLGDITFVSERPVMMIFERLIRIHLIIVTFRFEISMMYLCHPFSTYTPLLTLPSLFW